MFRENNSRRSEVHCDVANETPSSNAFEVRLVASNTGPGGKGKSVFIRGYEEWRFGKTSLIGESQGHFDEADYQRQLIGR